MVSVNICTILNLSGSNQNMNKQICENVFGLFLITSYFLQRYNNSGDLNNGQVLDSNGQKQSDHQMVIQAMA